MNDALRQIARPRPLEHAKLRSDRLVEARLDPIGPAGRRFVERPPSGDRERIGAPKRKVSAGEMQARQRFAHRGAMTRIGSADPHAVEKRDDRGRATRKGADHRAAAVLDRLRARQPAGGEMLHQSEKERQVARGDATLI